MDAAGGISPEPPPDAVLRALLIHHAGLHRADPLPVGTLMVNASGSWSSAS